MRKAVIGICIILISLFSCQAALAAEAPISNAPYLESVSFKNAAVDGGFTADKTTFDLILENPQITPLVENYSVSGVANVFVNYNYDKMNRQTGMQITLAFDGGSVVYTFNYKNLPQYKITDNANLASISCEYGEVQPIISKDSVTYKLYIPSDLTTIRITPITEDINAYCAPISIELNERQEPEISLTVKASSGKTRNYKFKVKRVGKTVEEVDREMREKDYISFVDGELYHQTAQFKVVALSSVGGAAALIIIALCMRNALINPYDREEKEFYLPNEDEENAEND